MISGCNKAAVEQIQWPQVEELLVTNEVDHFIVVNHENVEVYLTKEALLKPENKRFSEYTFETGQYSFIMPYDVLYDKLSDPDLNQKVPNVKDILVVNEERADNWKWIVFIILGILFILASIYFRKTILDYNIGNVFNNIMKGFYRFLGIMAIIFIISTPFMHYYPSRLMAFPKNSITLSHTFITDEDVEKAINQFNNASFMEKTALMNDPFYKKLQEKGITYDVKNDK